MSRAEFAKATGVSHETLARFDAYAALLTRWQAKINLVGPKTMPDLWVRHFLDSAQLFPLIRPGTTRLVDLGSGAGFPGLVLAILGIPTVHLIESDQRKAAFLREAARVTGCDGVTVHAVRAEAAPPLTADLVTARALASLGELLPLATRFTPHLGECLFLKGEMWEEELTVARETWMMSHETHPSLTSATGVVLRLSEIVHAPRSAPGVALAPAAGPGDCQSEGRGR